MSVRNAKERQRVVDTSDELASSALYRRGASVVLELTRLSNKLANRKSGRYTLEERIRGLVRSNSDVFLERQWSPDLDAYIHEAVQHAGWVAEFEALGVVTRDELEVGFRCLRTHGPEAEQLAVMYRPLNDSRTARRFGSRLVCGVVMARLLVLDPDMVIVKPALNSYTAMGCDDFYEMVREITKLLGPLQR